MNVLQVVPELNAGGVERTTLEIVEALSAKGLQSHVASAGGRMEDELTGLDGVLHRMNIGSKNPFSVPGHKRALIKIIRDNKIDIVHVRSRAPAWPAYYAARATGVPLVTTYHGIYNAKSGLKRFYNAIMTRGDHIIANSKFTRAHIMTEHGTSSEKITVIPRGVDMALFDPSKITQKAIAQQRRDWAIKPGQTVVLLPGRLTRWKGQGVAIEAMADLEADFSLVLMGDAQGRDDYVAELSTLIKAHNLHERVKIAGHSQSIALALASADCVISASIEPEAFGRVMAEAQAMGKPVVASAHGGALETVVDGETGRLVPPNDSTALGEAIIEVVNWTNHHPEQARRRIETQYSKRALQAATLGVYANIVGNSSVKNSSPKTV